MRLAVVSMHTSPLAQPGSSDAGGMNVYVRELVAGLAHRGVECVVYVRRSAGSQPDEVAVEPGFRVVHVDAGPPGLAKEDLPGVVDAFADAVGRHLARTGGADVLHANYWLSAVAAHQLKHRLDVPLVCTFHTLARVKAETGDPEPLGRERAEAEVLGCADVVLASCDEEEAQIRRLYGDPAGRIEIVAPGVEHAFFSPGDQRAARRAVGLDEGHAVLLFVGRIQPLKGVDVAVRALALLDDPTAELVVVGGASGRDGDREVERVHALVEESGLAGRVRFVPPQPHHLLASWYRASDVCLVPSRSESFGLVALEAAACGIPVVAANVGGLRSLVVHGETGFLVDDRDPAIYAKHVAQVLDDPLLGADLGITAAARARRYSWPDAAARLRDVCLGLSSSALVSCD